MADHMEPGQAPISERSAAPAPRTKGFVASAARTIGATVDAVYAAWTDDARRAEWLRDEHVVLTERTPGVSLHAAYGAGRLRVLFMPRGGVRSFVTVDHEGLPTARRAEQMTKFWRARLGRLAALLEHPRR